MRIGTKTYIYGPQGRLCLTNMFLLGPLTLRSAAQSGHVIFLNPIPEDKNVIFLNPIPEDKKVETVGKQGI